MARHPLNPRRGVLRRFPTLVVLGAGVILAAQSLVVAASAAPSAASDKDPLSSVKVMAPVKPGVQDPSPADQELIKRLMQGSGLGQTQSKQPQQAAQPTLNHKLIARAPFENCFVAIGFPYAGVPTPAPTFKPDQAPPVCPAGTYPQTQQDYIQGMGAANGFAIGGTSPRLPCDAAPAYSRVVAPGVSRTRYINPYIAPGPDLACEGGASPLVKAGVRPPEIGDSWTPHVYRMNAATDETTDITPTDAFREIEAGGNYAYSFRGGVGCNACDIIFLMDQEIRQRSNPNDPFEPLFQQTRFFAWQGSTGRFLGHHLYPDLIASRKGVELDGHLYLNARVGAGGAGTAATRGEMWKWTGTLDNPFQFETVGSLPGADPAQMTIFQGHIVANTWQRNSVMVNPVGGVYMSPLAGSGGLTAADANNWKRIFGYEQFEPDPFLQHRTDGGEISEWRGDLYFGSYDPNVTTYATFDHYNTYGTPPTDAGKVAVALGRTRPISFYRMTNPGQPNQRVELLYGDAKYPVYNPTLGTFSMQPNLLTGQRGRFGSAGFGNTSNVYTWTTWTFQGRLYFGTADTSVLAQATGTSMGGQLFWLNLNPVTQGILHAFLTLHAAEVGGGDIWRFDQPGRPAVPEDLHGLGNSSNHGVRTVTVFADKVIVGEANCMNLRSNLADRPGGWEIHTLTAK